MASIMHVLYLWAMNPSKTLEEQSHEVGISKDAIADMAKEFRYLCQLWFLERDADQTMRIGGPGTIVEIDETKVYKAKHNRGRALMVNREWVFGMIERGTNRVITVPVERRDMLTLIPIILHYVRPGTRIISDGWAAYGNLNNHGQYRFQWVNHRLHFVNPGDNEVHTQNIENSWGVLKAVTPNKHNTRIYRRRKCFKGLKNLKTANPDVFDGYLYNYMWRRHHGKVKGFHLFKAMVKQIRHVYNM